MDQVFEKKYTRDHRFILQEIWDDYLMRDYFGKQNPYFPSQINYLYDGAAELWDNKGSIKWFMDRLLLKNKKDKKFLHGIVKEHEKISQELIKISKKKYLKSVAELNDFLRLVKCGTYTFLAFYYSAVDNRTPRKLRDMALRVRAKDVFYDSADRLIRKTVEHLYPYTKGLMISILMNELNLPPSKDILKKRFKNCVMTLGGIIEIIDLELFARRNKKYKFLFDKIFITNVINGQIANQGYAKGKTKILRRVDQIKSLRQGEILVAPMTTPDFMPAIRKAAAIITDEGGITCHAAIVSRELKKPCIIGTKIATKVLKDGDLVEVDAEKGVVKILKKK